MELVNIIFLHETLATGLHIIPILEAISPSWHFIALDAQEGILNPVTMGELEATIKWFKRYKRLVDRILHSFLLLNWTGAPPNN